MIGINTFRLFCAFAPVLFAFPRSASADCRLQSIATLTAEDNAVGDSFGSDIAISGDTAAIMANYDRTADIVVWSVYVFRKINNEWVEIAKLTPSDAEAADHVGVAIDISGNTIAIGAPRDDDELIDSGSVYVFREVDENWQQIAKLRALDAHQSLKFGSDVSIDGNTMVVGASGDNHTGSRSGSAYVFREVGGVWQQIAKVTAADASYAAEFGAAVSLSGSKFVVGAPLDPIIATRPGSAYFFGEIGGVWQQTAKVRAESPTANAEFGRRLQLDGDTAVIGEPSSSSGGGAYVFRDVGGAWNQVASLMRTDASNNDSFGDNVALSGDTALVGTWRDDDNGSNSGSAYLYREISGAWQQIAKLTASDGFSNDYFGRAVGIQGDTALVGVPGDDDVGFSSGAVLRFQEFAGVWQEIGKLTVHDRAVEDHLGNALAASGSFAIVGASGDDDRGIDAGAAYVFEYTQAVWRQQRKLLSENAAEGDLFGSSIAMSGDAAIVGAPAGDTDGGSAYIFSRTTDEWSQVAVLTAEDASQGDRFGVGVAIDGATSAVGASGDDDNGGNSGAAYVFRDVNGSWQQIAKLVADDGATGDGFGNSVALSGNSIIIGSPDSDANGDDNSGSAYVFSESGGTWLQIAKLRASSFAADNRFGVSVAIDGDTAIVGAPGNESTLSGGAAYVFREVGGVWQEIAILIADDPSPGDRFGASVAVSGQTVSVGCPGDDDPASAGSVYVFREVAGDWRQVAKLMHASGSSDDGVGTSVAIRDATVFAGAVGDDIGGHDSGSVCVFDLSLYSNDCNANGIPDECELPGNDCNGNRIPDDCDIASLVASDCNFNGVPDECDLLPRQLVRFYSPDAPYANPTFARFMQVHQNTAVINSDDNYLDDQTIFVYRRNGDGWEESARLSPLNASPDVVFASSGVAFDGVTCAVAGYRYDSMNGTRNGPIFIFHEVAGQWQEASQIAPPAPNAHHNFGASICMSGDTMLVGAMRDDENGSESGAAHVFKEVDGAWQLAATLRPDDGAAYDLFGEAVALSDRTAVIGSPYDDDSGPSSGSAYVFENIDGEWQQIAKLTPDPESSFHYFGRAIAIERDTIFVGHPYDDDSGAPSGSVHVYRKIDGLWQFITKVSAQTPSAGNYFGSTVATFNSTLVASAPYYSEGNETHRGAVFYLNEFAGSWQVTSIVRPISPESGEQFGGSIAVDASNLLVRSIRGVGKGVTYSSVDFFESIPHSHDCNGNAMLDECEIQFDTLSAFVTALLSASTDPFDLCIFDGDDSGSLDGQDVAPFVTRLLAP